MKPINIYELDLVERLKLEDQFFATPFMMSYSGLNKLLYSPGAFYQHYILKQRDDVVDKGMAEGRLLHCMLFTPEKFDDEFVVLPDSFPSDNPKRVMERLRNHILEVYPEFVNEDASLATIESVQNAVLDILRDENLYQSLKTDAQRLEKILTDKNMEYLQFLFSSAKKIVVDKDMVKFAEKLKEEIMNKEHIKTLMGFNELDSQEVYNELQLACFLDYPFGITGILDNIVVDHKEKIIRINDLKKTSKALSKFHESIEAYNYWLQAALYTMIVHNVKKTTFGVDYPTEFRFVVVDPYMHVAAFKVGEVSMGKFMDMTTDALHIANRHFDDKDFSAPFSVLISENREIVI